VPYSAFNAKDKSYRAFGGPDLSAPDSARVRRMSALGRGAVPFETFLPADPVVEPTVVEPVVESVIEPTVTPVVAPDAGTTVEPTQNAMSQINSFLENNMDKILPVLGIIESIATKGGSPGTAAKESLQAYNAGRVGNVVLDQQKEELKKAALARQVTEKQIQNDKDFFKTRDLYMKDLGMTPEEASIKAYSDIYGPDAAKFSYEQENRVLGTGRPQKWQSQVQDYQAVQAGTMSQDEYDNKWYRGQTYQYTPDAIKGAAGKAGAVAGASEGARTAAERGMGINLNPTQVTGLSGTENSLVELNNLKSKFKPEWATVFVGQPISTVLSRFQKDRADFETTKQRFFNELLKARSGGAVTPNEYQRMRKELGDLSVTADVYITRLNNNMAALRQSGKTFLSSLQKSNYDVSGWQGTFDSGDQFVVGKLYKDASGNTARYMGDGKWESQ